jgi:hypothetical protein
MLIGAALFVTICGTWIPEMIVSIGANTKFPSGVRSEAGLSWRSFPGVPLKLFDCFASTCHVALPGVAVQAAVLLTETTALT